MTASVIEGKRVGQFMGVQADTVVTRNNRKFRILLYGAYNAMGLIGSERNGIAVLDEDRKCVLLDNECHISSGFYGASEEQQKRFKEVVEMKWPEFQKFVNGHEFKRMDI